MIFVDTSYLIAGLSAADAHHEEAMAIRSTLADEELLTTNHVIGECWTFARRRFGHRMAVALLEGIRGGSRMRVAHVEEAAEARALDWLVRHDEREFSFVDATSFETMRSRGLLRALAFDGDFTAVGFQAVRV